MAIKVLQNTEYAVSHSDAIKVRGGGTLTQKMDDIPEIDSADTSNLDVSDENDNVIMRLSEGHVRTRYFDSRYIGKMDENMGMGEYDEFDSLTSYSIGDIVRYNGLLYKFVAEHTGEWDFLDVEQTNIINEVKTDVMVDDNDEASLDFSDDDGFVVVRFNNGHVKTKNFDSEDVLQTLDALVSEKTYKYIGKKIDVAENKFDVRLFLSATSVYNDGSADHAMQAMAIYSDVIFCLYDAGYCRTYDYSTKELIDAFSTGAQIGTNHCGGAVFGDKFFANNTDFPALYESGDLTNLCCYVMSVSENSAELKQRLDFSTLSAYKKASGSQVVLDLVRQRLLYVQRTKSSIGDFTNTFDVCEFAIPELTDGIDDNGVLVLEMTDAMVLDHYVLPYYPGIYQADKIHNGQLIQLFGRIQNGYNSLGSKNGILVYDMTSPTHDVLSYIDLTTLIPVEPEGVEVYKGKLYVSHVDGKIYEFNF